MDMKMAMGMAVDLGLTGEEEGEEMMSMSDDQMVSRGEERSLHRLTVSSNPSQSMGTWPTYRWRPSFTTYLIPPGQITTKTATLRMTIPVVTTTRSHRPQTWTNTPRLHCATPFSL